MQQTLVVRIYSNSDIAIIYLFEKKLTNCYKTAEQIGVSLKFP